MASPSPLPVTRFTISRDEVLTGVTRALALSPNGRTLVYVDGGQLYQRSLDNVEAVPVQDTVGGDAPTISPDNQWVGFFSEGSLKKVALAGGGAVTLTEGSYFNHGVSWGQNDTLVFAERSGGSRNIGLWEVSAAGGEPRQITSVDIDSGETMHGLPDFLPGGESLLFEVRYGAGLASADSTGEAVQIAALSLATGQKKVLLPGTTPRYVSTGHIVFARDDSLWRVPFDVSSLELQGEPVPVLESVMINPFDVADYAVSDDGSLAYTPGGTTGSARRNLVWVDRAGREELVAAAPRAYLYPRISPDGTRVAVEEFGLNVDIWVWEFARETLTRLTVDPAYEEYPAWTPDGERIFFASTRDGGTQNPFSRAADGTGTAEKLVSSPNALYPYAVSPDGNRLILREGANDLVTIELNGNGTVEPLLASAAYTERNAELSPDGNWVAYESDESEQFEVYVRPFPNVDEGRWQISTEGGNQPVWARSGEELFFRNLDGALMGVPVETGGTFTPGNANVLVTEPYFTGDGVLWGRTYDASPDGQRFLVIKNENGDADVDAPHIVLVQNWSEELQN